MEVHAANLDSAAMMSEETSDKPALALRLRLREQQPTAPAAPGPGPGAVAAAWQAAAARLLERTLEQAEQLLMEDEALAGAGQIDPQFFDALHCLRAEGPQLLRAFSSSLARRFAHPTVSQASVAAAAASIDRLHGEALAALHGLVGSLALTERPSADLLRAAPLLGAWNDALAECQVDVRIREPLQRLWQRTLARRLDELTAAAIEELDRRRQPRTEEQPAVAARRRVAERLARCAQARPGRMLAEDATLARRLHETISRKPDAALSVRCTALGAVFDEWLTRAGQPAISTALVLALDSLWFPMLKLALADPGIAIPTHPARGLLEELAMNVALVCVSGEDGERRALRCVRELLVEFEPAAGWLGERLDKPDRSADRPEALRESLMLTLDRVQERREQAARRWAHDALDARLPPARTPPALRRFAERYLLPALARAVADSGVHGTTVDKLLRAIEQIPAVIELTEDHPMLAGLRDMLRIHAPQPQRALEELARLRRPPAAPQSADGASAAPVAGEWYRVYDAATDAAGWMRCLGLADGGRCVAFERPDGTVLTVDRAAFEADLRAGRSTRAG